MSFRESFLENPNGRSFIFSIIIVGILFTLAWLIPFAPYEEGAWYLFLYKDLTIDPADRFNLLLVIIDILIFIIFYFYLTIALGNLAEVRNTLPGWLEVLTAFGITAVMAALQPKFGTTGDIAGGIEDKGFNHFTPDMQKYIFWFTLLGLVLTTIYIYYTEPKDQQ